ncbi:MAG: TIGR00304 family membrane protein [Conexivisphaera sp.]
MRSQLAISVAGLALIIAGSALLALSTVTGPKGYTASYGGLLLIGPIPIIFGGGPRGFQLAELAVLMALLLMAVALLFMLTAPSPGEPEGGGHQEGQD